jgi:shikimate kinase
MIGSARTRAAITITNALSTGVGCAVGIELHTEARVVLEVDSGRSSTTLEIPPEGRTRLVEESLRSALRDYFPRPGVTARLTLSTEIPVARGLKSSSAVSTAILLAVARAARASPSPLEIGRRSAEVAHRVGVSATGALDDALAGLEPGFVVTDNSRGEVLHRAEVDLGWAVALYIPAESHPRSPNVLAQFSGERAAGEKAVGAALGEDWPTAMRINTEIVERAMGYSYGGIRDRLRAFGAVASGVSGLGPTLAAIAPTERIREVAQGFPSDDAAKLIVPFARTSSWEGGSR